MMKVEQREHRLLWLLRPENSSDWEAGGMRFSSKNHNTKGLLLSVTKFLLCYTVAIAVTVFLSGLH